MAWALFALLVLVLVLQRAWDYLYDRQFTWSGLFLVLALFGLWIALFLVEGWLGGLMAVFATFALGALLDVVRTDPLARLLRSHAERWSREERERFAASLDEATSEGFYAEMEDEHLENAKRCQMSLVHASIDQDVARALRAHGKHTEDLAALYFDRQVRDLPLWHRDRAVRNPHVVAYYFATAVDLPPARPSQALRAWIMERPAGAMPARLQHDRATEEKVAESRRAARA